MALALGHPVSSISQGDVAPLQCIGLLPGFAMESQVRRSTTPNRVRHPTDRQFASGCSPPRLPATQLPSATELWHAPTRTCTVLIWRHHGRTIPAYAGMTPRSSTIVQIEKYLLRPLENAEIAVARGVSLGYSPPLLLIDARKREAERVDKVTCLFLSVIDRIQHTVCPIWRLLLNFLPLRRSFLSRGISIQKSMN